MMQDFDTLEVGREYRSYARTVTETDLVNFTCFAGLKLPIFIDENYARTRSPHGGRIVPGFLTCSIVGGMMEAVLGPSTIGALGMDEMRFPAPVRPGDTIEARITLAEKRVLSDGLRGLLALDVAAFTSDDRQVLAFKSKVIVALGRGD